MIKYRVVALLLSAFLCLGASKCIGDAADLSDPATPGAGLPANKANPTAGAEMGVADTTLGGSDIAQSFTTSSVSSVTGVMLGLTAIAPGTTSSTKVVQGTLTVRLESDNGGAPSGEELATGTFAASSVTPGAVGSYDFAFASAVRLAAQEKYWIRLSASYGPNATSVVKWLASGANPLAGGQASYYSSGTLAIAPQWTTSKIGDNRDLLFVFTGTE